MTDTIPTEQEIVARAITDALFDGLEPFGAKKPADDNVGPKLAQAAIHALDQFRAKNAGEVERRLREAAEYHASNADHFESDINPKSVFAEEDRRVLAGIRERIASISDAANLITSLRSIIGEKE